MDNQLQNPRTGSEPPAPDANPRPLLTAAVAGGLATALDLGVLVVLVGRHVPIALATFIAAMAGAAANFVLNKYVAFRDRAPISLGQIVRFDLVAVVAAVVTAAAMKLATGSLGAPVLVAKLACTPLVFAIWTYPAQRHLVFPPKASVAAELATDVA